MDTTVITGSSGKAGRSVVRHFIDHGYKVLGVDRVRPERSDAPTLLADLTNPHEAWEAIKGARYVVHLANIPAPGIYAESRTLLENLSMNAAVFRAAADAGVERVSWASSETTLGLPFDTPPRFAPIDETHYPYPESSYALSKVLTETMAEQYARTTGIPFMAFRLSNVMEPHDYAAFPSYWGDAGLRRWNLWGYIDARDAAQAFRLGLEAPVSGAEAFVIAAEDTVMNRPSAELLAEVFPKVPLTRPVDGFESLLLIDKARRMLGYRPDHTWRRELGQSI